MKKLFLLPLLILVFSSFTNADLTTDNQGFYLMTSDCTTNSNGDDGTNNGATFVNSSHGCDFEQTESDYIDIDNIVTTDYTGTGLTLCTWSKQESYATSRQTVAISKPSISPDIYFSIKTHVNFYTSFSYNAGDSGNTWASDTNNIASDTTNWFHICAIYKTDNDIEIYTNGVNVANTSSNNTMDVMSTGSIGSLNWRGTEGEFYDGNIMGIGVWNTSLSTSDINTLYDGGNREFNPFVTNTPPIVNIMLPTVNDHLNDDPVLIEYNVTDVDEELINCTINVNDVNITTQPNINATSGIIQQYNFTTSEGVKNLTISCVDAITSNVDNSTFIVDRTSPDWTINTLQTDNTSIFDRAVVDFIYFNDSVDDTYLFAYNVTVKYPNGSIWFSNQTIDLNQSVFNYTFNKSIISSQPNGTYSINYFAQDDHTAKTIPNYNYDYLTDGLLYMFDGYQISVRTDNPTTMNSLNTTKYNDRYSFDFEYKTPKKLRIYSIRSNEKIYYRGGLYNYPVFVIKNNWVDFNIPTDIGTTYKVIKKDDYWYQIEVEKSIATITDNIKSLGGLNTVNETYLFQIKENNAPIIINTTPNQNFSVDDGLLINFTTTATDLDNDTIIYTYLFNGVLNFTGQNLTNFFTPHNSHGINNITVIATDGGKSDSFTWYINITDNPLGAIITNLVRSPLTNWYVNTANAKFICSGFDQDNETSLSNLTAEIDYRSGILWNPLIVTSDNNGNFTANISLTTLEAETLDVRCRINDVAFGFNTYTQVNNIVTILEAYVSVGNITSINPPAGNRDFVIPVTCDVGSFGSVPHYKLIYDIDYFLNNSWVNLSNNLFNKALFDMSLLNYGESVKFRCAVNDTVTKTGFNTGENVTRKHINNLMMYNKGQDEVMSARKPYYKSLLADFYNEANISIIASFVDCNGDEYWDHYFPYNDSRNNTRENFVCFNKKGVIKHTVGVLINKTGTNNLFCGDKSSGFCKIQRSYEVIVK